ncbi:MAG: hypothetical protein K2V38_29500 [Gemmataceae bacterium]|nr:hypothetical protein [Gemmataceae bacterium]
MRVIGIILVFLGAIGLAARGVTFAAPPQDGAGASNGAVRTVWVPPVVSGIVVVSGLLLLASAGRRDGG